jgi:hypothetical protein
VGYPCRLAWRLPQAEGAGWNPTLGPILFNIRDEIMSIQSKEQQVRYWASLYRYKIRKLPSGKDNDKGKAKFQLLGICRNYPFGKNYAASIDEIAAWMIENGGRL